MQKQTALGNLTNDPTIREVTVNGKKVKVCNFSIAANYGYGENKRTQYFDVEVWRGKAEICAKYLSKGRGVFVEGPVHLNSYIKKDGNVRSSIVIRGEVVEFIGSRSSNSSEPDADYDIALNPGEVIDPETGEILHEELPPFIEE